MRNSWIVTVEILVLTFWTSYQIVPGREICEQGRGWQEYCDDGTCCLMSGQWKCNRGEVNQTLCDHKKELEGWEIGLIVGIPLVVMCLVVGIIYFIRNRLRKRLQKEQKAHVFVDIERH